MATATTNATVAMARSHQALQVRQAAAVQVALSAIWDETMDPHDITKSFQAFREKAAPLIGAGRTLAERQATAYYQTLLAYKGLDPADLAGLAKKDFPKSAIKASLTGATGKHLNKAYFLNAKGLPNTAVLAQAKADMLGSAKRQILNASRDHLVAISRAHKHIKGWARVTDGKPCGFCAMLVGRGPVYSEHTAGFESHDKCGCSVRLVTYDEADGGWTDDAKAYRWAYDNGYQDIRQLTSEQLAAVNAARRAAGKGPKRSTLLSARWVNGYTSDDILKLYADEMAASSRALKKTPDGMPFPRLGASESYAEAAKHVNPHYSWSADYQNNCHLVSAAMELRARGYNVQALATIGAQGRYLPQMERDWLDATGEHRPFTNVQDAVGRKLAAGARLDKAIAEVTADYPDGARGFITGSWRRGGAHIWNWEKVNGKIVYYDGQPDGLTPDDVAGYLSRLKADRVSILRLDDLTPADRVKDLVTEGIEDTPVGHRQASIAYAERQIEAAKADVTALRDLIASPLPSPSDLSPDEYTAALKRRMEANAYAPAIEKMIGTLEAQLAEYRARVAKLEAMAL